MERPLQGAKNTSVRTLIVSTDSLFNEVNIGRSILGKRDTMSMVSHQCPRVPGTPGTLGVCWGSLLKLIELLWKFLKMHLKLGKLITKNVNGIAIQIYATLIAYLILQVIQILQQWGQKLLDKPRYLQTCMCQEISYVHWMIKLTKC